MTRNAGFARTLISLPGGIAGGAGVTREILVVVTVIDLAGRIGLGREAGS
jgi:hypothetical protein